MVRWMAVVAAAGLVFGQAASGSDVAVIEGLEARIPVEGQFLGGNRPDPVRVILQVRNTSGREHKAVVAAQLLLPTGRELDARTAVTGARGQTQQVELPLPERPPYGVLS